MTVVSATRCIHCRRYGTLVWDHSETKLYVGVYCYACGRESDKAVSRNGQRMEISRVVRDRLPGESKHAVLMSAELVMST